VLASEREDLYAVVAVVTDEHLVAYHRHPTSTFEQRQTKPVPRLQRLGVEGDDLVRLVVKLIGKDAKEQPIWPEHRAGDAFLRDLRNSRPRLRRE
jgi:hypothetical protein